jgi:hypothetical protein
VLTKVKKKEKQMVKKKSITDKNILLFLAQLYIFLEQELESFGHERSEAAETDLSPFE